MNLLQIGHKVRERRAALGLSQLRLAKLSGLSRSTVNQLENGVLRDLGVAKLMSLLDLLGLSMQARVTSPRRHGLAVASRTASVSYRATMQPLQLARALASGDLPAELLPHVATLPDEAPLPVLTAAVEEAATRCGVPPKRIWQHLLRWAEAMGSPRAVWA
jgi:transcriptional regulator with XRE-family HTH domain